MNRTTEFRKDNEGSVLMTVLITFMFLSVLVAIVLSTVSVNLKMRYIDRRTKDEFYYAEKALNDIYTGIGQDCSDYVGKEYNDVLNRYRDGATHTYVDQEKAYGMFVQGFVNRFRSNYQASALEGKFNSFIVNDTVLKSSGGDTSRALASIDLTKSSILYYKSAERNPSDSIPSSELPTVGDKVRCIVIKNVSVQSNPDANENIGYVSKITTDIVIDVPWIDFFNVNQSGFDFALSVNQGLYVEDGARVNVNGNLFAGTNSFGHIDSSVNDSSEYGGINIAGGSLIVENADYVISGGDINLIQRDDTTQMSKLEVKPTSKLSNQIWFENLECKHIGANDDSYDGGARLYNVEISGNVFASGDLQVDGNSADVTIHGSYYGYNSGSEELSMKGNGTILYTKESKYKTDEYNAMNSTKVSGDKENMASLSSSVIVNGRNNIVRFADLKTLMVMGNAFINHESGKNKGIVVQEGKINLGELPENVALKASQQIIYMPAEFLETSNPLRCGTGEADPFRVDSSIVTSEWFGKKYIDETNSHKIIKMKNNNTNTVYAYCYLNFKNETVPVTVEKEDHTTEIVNMSCKDAYVYELIQGKAAEGEPEPTAATLKKRISDSIKAYNSQVIVEETTDSRIYASSSIVEYGGGGLRYVTDPNMNSFDILNDYSINLYKRYRLMDTYLDTLKNEPLASNSVKSTVISPDDFEKDAHEMPFARYFWLTGVRDALNPSNDSCLCYDLDGVKLVIIRTSGELDLASVVDQNGNRVFDGRKNAIVLADGALCVGSGKTVSINGFLAATNKITVKDNATLNVNYDSGVINRRISAELEVLRKTGGFRDGTGSSDYEPLTEDILGISAGSNPHGNTSDNLVSKQLLINYLLRTDADAYGSGIGSNVYKLRARGDVLKKPSKAGITRTNIETKTTSDEKWNSNYITFYRMYQFDGKDAKEMSSAVNTDYTSYIYYDNWKKGQE